MPTNINHLAGIVSTDNSTAIALSPTSSWTGSFEDVSAFPSVVFSLIFDTSGSLLIDFSTDAVNLDRTSVFNFTSSIDELHRLSVTHKYYRARIFNAATSSQSYLRFQTLLGSQTALSNPANKNIQHDTDATFVRSLESEIDIAAGKYEGYSIINVVGRNPDVDAAADIWELGGVYSGFPTGSAEKIQIFSSDQLDNATGSGARTYKVFGLDSEYDRIEEVLTLNGTIPVTSSQLFTRVYQGQCLTAGSSNTNVGILTVRHNTTTTNVFSNVIAGTGQDAQLTYTIPAGHTGYLREFHFSMLDNTSNNAVIALWVREFEMAERLMRYSSINNASQLKESIYGGIKLPEKTDIKFRCISIVNVNGHITGNFDLLLIENV